MKAEGRIRRATVEKQAAAADGKAIDAMADRLRPIIHRLSRSLRREAVTAGISSLDIFILGMVRLKPGIGISELAHLEDTTRPTMSSHVKRLKEAGWIVEDASRSTDARRISLVLTTEGRNALARVRQRSNDWLAQQLGVLSREQLEALDEAMSALEQITHRGRK